MAKKDKKQPKNSGQQNNAVQKNTGGDKSQKTQPTNPPQKRSKLFAVAVAIAVLLLLGLLAWGIIAFLNRDDDGDSDSSETTTESSTSTSTNNTATDQTTTTETTDTAGTTTSEVGTTSTETSTTSEATTTSEPTQGENDDEGDQNDDNQGQDNDDNEGDLNGDGIRTAANWVANNYNNGDITGNEYQIVYGDTLWEIAEARYGSGFEWVKIRDANPGKVALLPDGKWALIVPGDQLVLP